MYIYLIRIRGVLQQLVPRGGGANLVLPQLHGVLHPGFGVKIGLVGQGLHHLDDVAHLLLIGLDLIVLNLQIGQLGNVPHVDFHIHSSICIRVYAAPAERRSLAKYTC